MKIAFNPLTGQFDLVGDGGTISLLNLKGQVATVAGLPSTGNTIGDVWQVVADLTFRVWDGAAWDNLGTLQGPPGQSVELQKTATHIQWRVVGGTWANLVALSEITGPAGAGGSSSDDYAVGNWIQPFVGTYAASGSSVANTIYLYAFKVRRSITVSDLGGRVATATAGSNLQLAVYASSSAGLPTGLPLGNTSSLSGGAAAPVSSGVASPFNLFASPVYWAAFNADATIPMLTFAANNTYASSIIGSPNLSDIAAGTNNGWVRTFAQTFGTWPDLTSATTTVLTFSSTNRAALVFLKVSALL